MPLRVGLTGGIASGKSTVAERFAALGAAVIDADQVSREILQSGSPVLTALFARFEHGARARYGQGLRRDDGSLDRRVLRRLVFEDAGERAALDALLHPAIRARMEALAASADSAAAAYQLHVVPLLVENHAAARFDRVLVVDCSAAVQRERLMSRDGIDAPMAEAMLAAQVSRPARLAAADDVIVNEADLAALDAPVGALDRRYRALAGQSVNATQR